jgi:hypothetical protein
VVHLLAVPAHTQQVQRARPAASAATSESCGVQPGRHSAAMPAPHT